MKPERRLSWCDVWKTAEKSRKTNKVTVSKYSQEGENGNKSEEENHPKSNIFENPSVETDSFASQ